MKSYLLGALAAAAVLSMSACTTVDLDQDKDFSKAGTDAASIQKALNDPSNPLYKKEVHFEFDSYDVSQDQMPIVTNHARVAAANKNVKITLQGHTDERGGREYNLALGQKRAEAVKTRMTMLGVSPDQIETVSFGKEKPRSMGSDEAAYYDNRRVDIKYDGF